MDIAFHAEGRYGFGMATELRAGRSGESNPVWGGWGGRDFGAPVCRTALGPTQPPMQWLYGPLHRDNAAGTWRLAPTLM